MVLKLFYFNYSIAWNAKTCRIQKVVFNNPTYAVSFAKFTPNGKYILVSTWNNTLELWDYTVPRCVKTYKGHVNENYCIMSSIIPNGKVIFHIINHSLNFIHHVLIFNIFF